METSKLYLIPSYLGENSSSDIFSNQLKVLIPQLKHYIVENEKSARKFLKFIYPEINQNELAFTLIDKRFKAENTIEVLEDLKNGNNVGLVSEAGTPCIADPGNIVVEWCHKNNYQVVPLVGPSSILLALMASGMNGQLFEFHGYLPIDKRERIQKLRMLEKESQQKQKTQIFMETPFRNNALLEDLKNTLQPDTDLCLASQVTLPSEYIRTKSIQNWKQEKIDLHKKPTIFIIQA